MTDFFTADWHLFHPAIINFCKRPFKNEDAMRAALIRNCNEVVGPGDVVYHIGDFAMLRRDQISKIGPVLDKLNGTHILVLGNHDEGKPFTYERLGFLTVHTALIYNSDVILRHDPAACVVQADKLWLVGHVHNLFKCVNAPIRCYNVGVDVNNFYPVTLEQIYNELKQGDEATHVADKVELHEECRTCKVLIEGNDPRNCKIYSELGQCKFI